MAFVVDILARVTLMPVLLAQSAMCYRRAHSLPAPAGPRMGTMGQGPKLRILIIGDSSALGVGTIHQRDALSGQLSRKLAADYTVSYDLVAAIGADTGDTLDRLSRMAPTRYDIILTCLGVNDVTHRVSLRRWKRQTREMIATLEDKFGARLIVVSQLPPVHHFPLLPNPLRWVLGRQARRFNRALYGMAKGWPRVRVIGRGLALVPEVMSVDGFHPGPPVYAEWANQVILAMREDGPPEPARVIDRSGARA